MKNHLEQAFNHLRISLSYRLHPARLRGFFTKAILLLVIVSMLSAPFAGTVRAAPKTPIQGSTLPLESDLAFGPAARRSTVDETNLQFNEGANDFDERQNRWDVAALISSTSVGRSRDQRFGARPAALQQGLVSSGTMIFDGPLETVRDPIPAIPGHRYVMQVAFERPECGSCNASAFVGPDPFVWPNNIYRSCWTGYGPAQECSTSVFTNSSNALYFEIWITVPPMPPEAGIVRIFDLDLPPGTIDESAMSSCQPKEDQGDERECQVNGTKETQGYAGDPINTRTGTFDMIVPDLSVNTAAGPLMFQRTYSSAATDLYTSSLGPGWTYNQDTRLIFPDDPGGEENSIWFKAHTANLFRFIMVGNGTFEAYPGVLATLVRNSGPPLSYTLTNRAQQTYTFDADGVLLTWTNALGNGFLYEYDAMRRLESVSNDSGQRFLAFGYDAQGRITSVDDHSGRNLTFTYDVNGDLATLQDPLGETWAYAYDAEHRLTQITNPNGVAELRIEYDAQGRAIRQYDGLGNLVVEVEYGADGTTTLTDALGNTTTHVYDTERGVLEQEIDALNGITARTYDANLRLETLTVPLGNVSFLEWSVDGQNLERTIDPAGFETIMDYNAANRLELMRDPLSRETRFEYTGALLDQVTDARNNTTTYTYTTAADAPQPPGLLQSVEDALLRETTYTYDLSGDRIGMVDALNQAWAYEYNALGWLAETTNARGATTRTSYDDAGRITQTIQNYDPGRAQNEENLYNITTALLYDALGNLTTVIDTANRVTRFEYDDENQLLATIENYRPGFLPNQETNVRTQFSYDIAGNPIAVIDPLGRITRTYYDALNRPVTVVQNLTSWDVSSISPPPFDPAIPDENVPTTYRYDANGNLIQVQDVLGVVANTCYDPRGLPTKAILNPTVPDPCIAYAPSANPALDIVQSQTYDAVANLLSSTDPNGEVTNYAYDDVNRLLSIRNPLGFVTSFGYDAVGNQTSMTDAEGVATRYEYDALNRLDGVVQNFITAGPLDQETNVRTAYAYDPVGNLRRITDALGSGMSYTYNGLNQMVGEDDPLGNTLEYDYDAVGRLDRRTDPKGSTTAYGYDGLNRLLTIDYPAPDADVRFAYDALGNPQTMLDGLGLTTWSYDGLNRPLTINDPFSAIVAYAYDAVGNRTGITYPDGKAVRYDYDSAYRLLQVEDWDSSLTTYTYDKAGQPLTSSLPNGITSSFGWDSAGRLQTLTHNANGFDLASYAYSYDKLGNRTQAAEYVHQPLKPPAGPYTLYLPMLSGVGTGSRDTVIDYEYDPVYRLTDAEYSSGEFFTYEYDAVGNRLSQQTELETNTYQYDAAQRLIDVDGVAYTWDDNGNLIDDGTRTFTYDSADRLIAVSDQGSDFIFSYDGLGNRYQQTIDNTTTTYALDLAAGLTQVLGDGSRTYTYGLGRIGGEQGGAWQYPLGDALGSTRQLTNASADVSMAQSFEPFGAPMATAGSESSDFGFTGEQDDIAGLVFLRARFYDPSIGRFLTRDPFAGFSSLPSTLHPYSYAMNNPVNLVDPSGQFAFLPLLLVGLAGGVLGGLGYYGLRQLIEADPCIGVQWDWAEAAFWAGVGGALGTGLGLGAGWFGFQVGLWGPGATATAYALGRLGEQAARITSPKTRIPSLTDTASFRVPDALDRVSRMLVEVKNVAYLPFTRQLQDYALFAKERGYTFILTVRQTTELSTPMQEAIRKFRIIVEYLPW